MTKIEKQSAALSEFAGLLDKNGNLRPRARHLRWNESFHEPESHRWWRCCRLLLDRCTLFVRAGLGVDGEHGLKLRSLRRQERVAFRAMKSEREQMLLWAERARARTRADRGVL
jgi:hypothetical protein